ncbi:hypothetical protein GD1_125 [Paraglaciecola Antarctic GD virus 1]|nr:hypothetical protein GD1_125 [Paraglaciecola Antarctic GD virus 1]
MNRKFDKFYKVTMMGLGTAILVTLLNWYGEASSLEKTIVYVPMYEPFVMPPRAEFNVVRPNYSTVDAPKLPKPPFSKMRGETANLPFDVEYPLVVVSAPNTIAIFVIGMLLIIIVKLNIKKRK